MPNKSLQEAIDEAGSPTRLLWSPDRVKYAVPIVAPEHEGWAQEQEAWRSSVALMDQSYHMIDTFIEGPGATQLLSEISANNYEKFAIGQGKQFVAVAYDGNAVGDGILLRTGENSYILTGDEAMSHWFEFHAQKGEHNVTYTVDPNAWALGGRDPRLFRFELQGPAALEVAERALGAPAPDVKFFHTAEVTIAGRPVRALRHGMSGQPGFEFSGAYSDYQAVKDALLAAGEPAGLVQVGGISYFTTPVESGWIAAATPAIYTDPQLRDYREWVGAATFEGSKTLWGSFYSDRIEDYYVSPWESGIARAASFNHEFIGKEALLEARDRPHRTKVTLELDSADASAILDENGFVNSHGRYRIEADGELVGITIQVTRIEPLRTVLALSLVDEAHAAPGTRVELVWGHHPGPDAPANAAEGFQRIGATVRPSPYEEYARSEYRKD